MVMILTSLPLAGKARDWPKATSMVRVIRVFLNETILKNVLKVELRSNCEELR